MALGDNVPDIFPVTIRTNSTVARHGSVGSGSALLGKSSISQIVLTEHLDMDAKLLDVIGGEGDLQDVVGLTVETTEGDIEKAHIVVG